MHMIVHVGALLLYISMYIQYYNVHIHCTYIYYYMLGAKYGFAQSMDCAAQTMDPYFVRAIHGLRVHV